MLSRLKSVLNAGISSSDIGGGKVLKKASIIWKLFILVMVGISGVYLCFLGVDWTMDHSVSAADMTEGRCSKKDRDNFAVHYPEPSTYSR